LKSKILEYFDFKIANRILEDYNKSTGFVTAILDLDGNVLSKSGWRQICTDFHRKNPRTAVNCYKSDTALCIKNCIDDKCNYYKCLNGLVDVQAPIIINGEHIANIFTGQLLFEEADISFFKKQAKTYGFNEKEYIEAVKKVPVFSKDEVETNMKFLQKITNLLFKLTSEKIIQIELNEELKKSEAELKKNQISLENIIEGTNAGTWELNVEKNEEIIDEKWAEMIGYTVEELSPMKSETWKKITHPDDIKRIEEESRKLYNNKIQHYDVEFRMKHKNGKWVWINDRTKVTKWSKEGKVLKVSGTHIDISDKKEKEAEKYKEREQFKTTLLSVGDAVISTDKKGKIKIMNKVAENLTGWSQEESFNQPLEKVLKTINEFTRRESENPAKKALELGKIVEMENHTILISKDGKEIAIEDSAAPIKDKDGNIRGAVIVFRDFTEKRDKQKEIEYLSFHDHLTGLYNRRYMEDAIKRLDTERNIPFSIIVADVNGLKLANDSYGHKMGDKLLITAGEIIKKSCRKEDVISRVGGDEFVILLPGTDSTRAEEIKNKILEETNRSSIDSVIISLALGYSTKNTKDKNILEVYREADNKMYKNKLKYGRIMRNKTIETVLLNINNKYDNEQIHSERVSQYCSRIASAMKLSNKEIEDAKLAGALHDIGKIVVPPEILNKKNKLKEEEWEIIKKHPLTSYQLLKSVDEYTHIAEAVLYHHERLDSKGYPEGLEKEEIPPLSKIIAVADAYEAMTANRPYKTTKTKEEALEELKKHSGSQFDEEIVDIFINKVL